MLLKFTTDDVHQMDLIDCVTGKLAFRTVTHLPARRSRSSSGATACSSSSDRLLDEHRMIESDKHVTLVEDFAGNTVAEITWEGNTASLIQIGEDTIKGTAELFDAAFVKILPDETLMPTRLEYVWRLTPNSLDLLNDDGEVIGTLHENHILSKDVPGTLVPSSSLGSGFRYLELDVLPEDELVEMIVCCLLLHTLRERMYAISKHVYGRHQNASPLARFRRRATHSFANLRSSLRRTPAP